MGGWWEEATCPQFHLGWAPPPSPVWILDEERGRGRKKEGDVFVRATGKKIGLALG